MRYGAGFGALKSRLLPDVRILGRGGAEGDGEGFCPAKVPVDAVEAGLEGVGVKGGDQGAGGVADLDDDGVGGREVEDVAEGGAGVFEQAEGGALSIGGSKPQPRCGLRRFLLDFTRHPCHTAIKVAKWPSSFP